METTFKCSVIIAPIECESISVPTDHPLDLHAITHSAPAPPRQLLSRPHSLINRRMTVIMYLIREISLPPPASPGRHCTISAHQSSHHGAQAPFLDALTTVRCSTLPIPVYLVLILPHIVWISRFETVSTASAAWLVTLRGRCYGKCLCRITARVGVFTTSRGRYLSQLRS